MKIFNGKVVRKKMQSTASVQVVRVFAHHKYGKRVRRTKKFQVHDDIGTQVGDNVRFVATKPVSKTKKWKIIEIVKKKQ